MAKNSIRDYSATNSSNTDIQSIDISEGCSPAGINNAIREVMADLKDVSTGAVALESPAFDSASLTGDLTFGNNDKAIFGAGSDLQIYNDGSNSIIDDAGSGRLYLRSDPGVIISKYTGEVCAQFNADADVKLYYDDAEKLATTSFGAQVTGSLAVDTITNASASTDVTIDTNFDIILDAGGNVGIGTSSPSANLEIDAGSATGTHLQVTTTGSGHNFDMVDGTGTARFRNVNGEMRLYGDFNSGGNGNIIFLAQGTTEGMRINSGGDLLVGTASTGVIGAYDGFTAYSEGIIAAAATSNRSIFSRRSTNGSVIDFRKDTTTVGSISVTGSSTAYNTSSDYRLKENVVADWDATTRLKQLNPVRFNFIADPDTTVDGFLAHEVQDIVPEAISGEKDAMRDEEYEVTPAVLDEDGNEITPAVMGTRSVPDYQGIDQSKLVPLLVKTIQELEARVAALENA